MMNHASASRTRTGLGRDGRFTLYSLVSETVEAVAVPALGGRIISLKDRRTGRDWLWHPRGGLKLFPNRLGDDFSTSPLAGLDECFPTIAPCTWHGRALPDHGELWSAAWDVDPAAWRDGALACSLRLPVSPFRFERVLRVEGSVVRLNYTLTSLSRTEERFLWAMHPLLRLQPGDRLELPASTRTQLNGERWVDAVDVAVPERKCAKAFAPAVAEGRAAIRNPATGDALEFSWDPGQNDVLGLWLSRGGWHGHEHFAIEPTNADHDSLATAVEHGRGGAIAPHGTLAWQVRLRLGS